MPTKLTRNEQGTIHEIYLDSRVSLRDIVKRLNLGGVASAAHIVSSLERKGYLKKIGRATNKRYELTDHGREIVPKLNRLVLKASDIPEVPVSHAKRNIDIKSTGSVKMDNHLSYGPHNFRTDSTGPTENNQLGVFLSANFMKIISSQDGWAKYGDVIVLTLILTAVVLPTSRIILADQWVAGLAVIGLFALLAIIINKKK